MMTSLRGAWPLLLEAVGRRDEPHLRAYATPNKKGLPRPMVGASRPLARRLAVYSAVCAAELERRARLDADEPNEAKARTS